jgi:hypothetical protein
MDEMLFRLRNRGNPCGNMGEEEYFFEKRAGDGSFVCSGMRAEGV